MEPVADLPEDLLILWLSLMTPKRVANALPEVKFEELDERQVAKVNELLAIVKGRHPVLAYDDWCKVSWAVAKELGREAGEVVMREYYPEQEPGEYRNIYRTYDVSKSPSMGTVRKIYAGIISKREEGKEKYKEYLSRQQEIEQLEQRIKEMKNGKK
jgi:hypothetical protein